MLEKPPEGKKQTKLKKSIRKEDGELSQEFESSESDSQSGQETEVGTPVGGKRNRSLEELSPRERRKKKRTNKVDDTQKYVEKMDGIDGSTNTEAETIMTTKAHHQPPTAPEPTAHCSRYPPNENSIPAPRTQYNLRYSFIVKCTQEIQLSKLVIAVGKVIPKSAMIIRHSLAKNKKVALFKTRDTTAEHPSSVLNQILKQENQNQLAKLYGI